MPANPEIPCIDHVQITVPYGSESRARAFYCDVLGLVEIDKPESLTGRGGFWLQIGSIQLHIGTEPDWDRLQTKAHVAYRVSDLGAWRARVESAGCLIEKSVAIPGFDRFETRDPFGNRLEFIQSIGE